MSQQLMKVTGDIKSLSYRDLKTLASALQRAVVREPVSSSAMAEALLEAALEINPDVDTASANKEARK